MRVLCGALETLAIDAPSKRKAPAAASSSSSSASTASSTTGRRASTGGGGGHYGLNNDSIHSLALVAVSRLIMARDEDIVRVAAQTPIGATVLSLLRAAVVRVATSAGGGAAPSFDQVSAATLFNLSGSVVANRRQYEGGLSLPSKLPWPRARVLTNALLESLNAARATEVGVRVGALLRMVPAAPALDAATQADVAALVSAVEADTRSRLAGATEAASDGGPGRGSSTAAAAVAAAAAAARRRARRCRH